MEAWWSADPNRLTRRQYKFKQQWGEQARVNSVTHVRCVFFFVAFTHFWFPSKESCGLLNLQHKGLKGNPRSMGTSGPDSSQRTVLFKEHYVCQQNLADLSTVWEVNDGLRAVLSMFSLFQQFQTYWWIIKFGRSLKKISRKNNNCQSSSDRFLFCLIYMWSVVWRYKGRIKRFSL